MSFFGDLMGGQMAYQIGKFNKAQKEYNASVKEQAAKTGFEVYQNYDLPYLEDQEKKYIGSVKVGFAKGGVERSGTALDNIFASELSFARDKDMLEYNALVRKQQLENQAILDRNAGMIAQYEGKVRRTASYFEAGSSLLTDYGTYKGLG